VSLVVLAILVAVVLLVVANRRRWLGLGRSARVFGRRVREGYQRPDLPPAAPASEADRGYGALGGYLLIATDGSAGQVERLDAPSGELIVTIDPLVSERVARVPVNAILEIDRGGGRIFVDRSKEELATASSR
jgi:hypothetical protein